jgi:hypothetical protein
MSGSCCGGSAKSEPNKVAMTIAPKKRANVAKTRQKRMKNTAAVVRLSGLFVGARAA